MAKPPDPARRCPIYHSCFIAPTQPMACPGLISIGIAEHLTKHGLLFCVDAHRDGKRFIVKADDLLTAFLSLERDAIAPKGANGNATRQNVG
jgi:hypothetical protein